MHARVAIGDADFEVIPTSNGQGEIKNDIIAEHKSGHISLRLFNTHISELTSGKTYELSHMVLKQFQGTHYMHASTDSKITIITDLQINLKVDVDETVDETYPFHYITRIYFGQSPSTVLPLP